MKANSRVPKTVDEYIAGFPHEVQAILERIRRTIRKAAPDAKEAISYHMPGFMLNGYLVHFAAYKKHIGLYPAPKGTEQFNKRLATYRSSKSTVKFPLDEPIPYDLIRQIVKIRVRDNLKKEKANAT
jgi:uncharacterized protein YdhG (YjbR/CyaY superfamily)